MSEQLMSAEEMIAMFTYRLTASRSIDSIREKVPAECEKFRFSLLQTYVYHEIVASKGFPIDRKVYIYEICQAKTAAGMLTHFPEFSIFMPCKLVIYEENGKTIVSTMNMGIVLEAVKSNKELYADATTLFNTLKEMMETLIG